MQRVFESMCQTNVRTSYTYTHVESTVERKPIHSRNYTEFLVKRYIMVANARLVLSVSNVQ